MTKAPDISEIKQRREIIIEELRGEIADLKQTIAEQVERIADRGQNAADLREARSVADRIGREWKERADAFEREIVQLRFNVHSANKAASFWHGVAMGIDASKAAAALDASNPRSNLDCRNDLYTRV